jgi:hypothetical protein
MICSSVIWHVPTAPPASRRTLLMSEHHRISDQTMRDMSHILSHLLLRHIV